MVIISSSISQSSYTGNDTGHCWISTNSDLIWSFLAPIYVITILNTGIIISSAIRIGTAKEGQHQMFMLRGFLVSSTVLTLVLGVPWFLPLIEKTTSQLFNDSDLATFFDWAFVCLNAPAGIVFLIIVAQRVKEVRENIAYYAANKVKFYYINPKHLSTVTSRHLGAMRVGTDINAGQPDTNRSGTPAELPTRPELPERPDSLFPKYSVIATTNPRDTVYNQPIYISIDEVKGSATANKTNGEIEGVMFQNIATIEQGDTQTEFPIEEPAVHDSPLEMPQHNPVDAPGTATLRSHTPSLQCDQLPQTENKSNSD